MNNDIPKLGNLISINDAVSAGIRRVRLPNWANPDDYLLIDIINGSHGPWFHLYSPENEVIGQRNPQDIICVCFNLDDRIYQIFGRTPSDDEGKLV